MRIPEKVSWLVGVLLALPSVLAAQGLPAMLDPIVQIFGTAGLGGIYTQRTALLWDSILALVIFISISMFVFKKKFPDTRALPVVIGIVLAVGYAAFEQSTGFRLSQMAPIAVLIMFGFFVFIIYSLLHTIGVHNRVIAFLAAFTIIFWILPQNVLDWLALNGGPTWGWIQLIAVIGMIALIISVFMWIGKMFKGGSGSGSSGSGGGLNDSGSHKAAASLASSARKELDHAAEEEKKRKEREEKAKEAAQLLNKELDKLVAETYNTSTTNREAAKNLLEYLKRVKEFIDKIHSDVEPNVGKETYKNYEAEITNYKEQLKHYFEAIYASHATLAGHYKPADLGAMTQGAKDQRDSIGLTTPGGFASELYAYEGWAKRRATVAEHWNQQQGYMRAIGMAWRVLKDKLDGDISILSEHASVFDLIYKTEDLARAFAKEIQDLQASDLPASAIGVTGWNFHEDLKEFRDKSEQTSNKINSYRQLMTGLRSELEPVRNAYGAFDEAFTKREKIITEWTELLVKIGDALDKLGPAVIAYVEKPTSGNYKTANKPLKTALEGTEKVEKRIAEQAVLDERIREAVTKVKAYESDTRIKPIVDVQFKTLMELLLESIEVMDRARLLMFEVQSYAEMWKIHPYNQAVIIIPGLVFGKASTTPRGEWTQSEALIAAGVKTTQAQDRANFIHKIIEEINNITARKQRRFTEYRKDIVENVDGLFEAAQALGSPSPYAHTASRLQVWKEVQDALDKLRKDWEDLQARLRPIIPP